MFNLMNRRCSVKLRRRLGWRYFPATACVESSHRVAPHALLSIRLFIWAIRNHDKEKADELARLHYR